MRGFDAKKQYATAVLSGLMTRLHAYATYIDQNSKFPSQSAYRLEQTKHMSAIMEQVKEDLALSGSLQQKQLDLLNRSEQVLDNLLEAKNSMTIKEQLSLLRLVQRVQTTVARHSVQLPPLLDTPRTDLEPVTILNKAHAVSQ